MNNKNMKTKKCTKCKKVKSLDNFCKQNSYKDGYTTWCKQCVGEYQKQHHKKHYKPKPIKTKTCKICDKKFKPTGKNQKYCSKQCYKTARKEQHKKYYKEYKQKNKDKIKKYAKKYQQKNKERINKYLKQRRKTDINFRIISALRSRLNLAIKQNWKTGHTLELLGCSIDELKKYIESLFKPGMTWENYGKWHIDHIKPCSSFDLTKESEQHKCFHYTNLQPMWASENIRKGGTNRCIKKY